MLTPFLDQRWNAWLAFGPDPLLQDLLQIPFGSHLYQLILFFVFGVGSFVYFRNTPSLHATRTAFLTAITLFLLVLALSFGSIVIWSVMAWTPWLALGYMSLAQRRHPLWLLFVIFFSLRIAQSALYCAPIALTIALAWWWTSPLPRSQKATLSRPVLIGIALSVLVITARLALLPEIPRLDYPAGARLIPDDGVPGVIRPLVGFDLPFETFDLSALKDAYLLPALILTGTALLTLFLRTGSLIAVALVLSVVADLALPRELALIAPLASVSRLIPGAFVYPLHPFFLIGAALFSTLAFLRADRIFIAGSLAACLWILTLSPSKPGVDPNTMWGQLVNRTPSRLLLQNFGERQLHTLYDLRERQFLSLSSALAKITVSGNDSHISAMTDGGLNTRWNSRPDVHGREWVLLELQPEILVRAVRLETGKFRSDFPRKVELRGFDTCPASDHFLGGTVIYRSDDWPGSIAFTPSGLPYLIGQDDAIFAIDRPFACILIERWRDASGFDWSIAELQGIY